MLKFYWFKKCLPNSPILAGPFPAPLPSSNALLSPHRTLAVLPLKVSFFFSLVYGYEKSNFISSYKLLNPLEVHISEEKKEKHETTNQPKFVMEQKCCHQAHASSTQTQGSTHPSSMFHHGTLTRRSMQPMRNI